MSPAFERRVAREVASLRDKTADHRFAITILTWFMFIQVGADIGVLLYLLDRAVAP
jgi:hypothetical protein